MSLFRSIGNLQPGERLDHEKSLKLAARPNSVIRSTSKENGTSSFSANDHVLRGFSCRTKWSSFSSTFDSALLYSLWLHAKAGPAPAQPRVSARGEIRSKPIAARPPHCEWQADVAPLIFQVDSSKLKTIRLDSESARKRQRLDSKASVRAAALSEVLVESPVKRSALQDVFLVDFSRPYGSRMPRFSKDYFNMVVPKVKGVPKYDEMRHKIVNAFSKEGAYLSKNNRVILPPVVLNEFRENATRKGFGV